MWCSTQAAGLAVAVAMMATLTSCGPDDVSTATAESPITAGLDGPVMRHLQAQGNDGEDADISGVVEIDGDCLYVALDAVGERYPIVWPGSTSWSPELGRVLLPDGDSVGHGDRVHGGGGYRHVDEVTAIAGQAAAALARDCADNRYREIAVVNNQPDGIRAGARRG